MTPVQPVLDEGRFSRREPTVLRAVLLMAGLLGRRLLNRLARGLGRKKAAARSGTARKGAGSVVFMVFLAGVMAWNAVMISVQLLNTMGDAVSHAPHEARARAVGERHREHGAGDSASLQSRERGLIPRLWQRSWRESGWVLCKAMGAMLLLLAATRFFMTLGSANQDLGRVEWSAEWFFTLPLPARHFFAAQILGHALIDPFSWVAVLPFFLTVFISAGLGWWSPAAAMAGTLYLAVVMASLRVLAETWLRRHFPPARLKNMQAVFTVLGISLFFVLLLGCRNAPMITWVVDAARQGASWLPVTPFALPILFAGDVPAAVVLAGLAVTMTVVLLAAVSGCAWLIRDGLMTVSGAYAGRRGAPSSPGRFFPAGIVGKDVRLLLRDRNFLVQALVVPVILVGFQLLFGGGLAAAIGSNFQHAATFAYALGAYALTATALNVLAVEGNSLWMLYGFPVPLHRIMLTKTVLWAGCALAYTVVALTVCAGVVKALGPADLVYAFMACAGVVIQAFIAAGLGMLGTDPLETEVKRRLRVDMVYLYMILAAMFGYAIYAPSWWTQAGQLVLSCLLAYALWQKVRDHAPFLLDPVAQPPPVISLADGMIAALAFFVLQGLFQLFALTAFKAPAGPALTIAFLLAGVIVTVLSLHAFWRRKVPHLAAALGLEMPWKHGSRRRALAVGLAAGGLAGCGALFYLWVLASVPLLRGLRDEALAAHRLEGGWLVLLALVAAPLCEEFIFRGIVFRGMRRSLSVGVSVLASAGVFALCHPPMSVAPVFIMAVLAAWSFERTKWLITPIIVHAVYNGMALWGDTLIR